MKVLKTWALAFGPVLFGIATAAMAMLGHERVLCALLGHELNLKESVLNAMWLRIADFFVVWELWQRVLWPRTWDREGTACQVGQVRLAKSAILVAGISSALWLVLLISARLCWTGPLGWLLDGSFIAITRPWALYMMMLVLTMSMQATMNARNELVDSTSQDL